MKATILIVFTLCLINASFSQTLFVPSGTVGTSSNGNVGIGTSDPQTNLHIEGAPWSGIKIRNATTTGGRGTRNQYLDGNNDGWQMYFGGHYLGQPLRFGAISQGTYTGTIFTLLDDGKVGIGTETPSTNLDLYGNFHLNSGLIQFNRTYEDYGNVLNLRTKDNNHFGDFRFEAEHTDTNAVKMLLFMNGDKGSVGIGTEVTGSHKLAVEGSIGAREVKVEVGPGWSDFVFENDYELRTLEEVETYIEENKHLPEIPSEAEVTENGINLGEMNAKLLMKIEELTLYMIEMNKRMGQLEAENVELKSSNQELSKKIQLFGNQ